jgi:hypothetical protein
MRWVWYLDQVGSARFVDIVRPPTRPGTLSLEPSIEPVVVEGHLLADDAGPSDGVRIHPEMVAIERENRIAELSAEADAGLANRESR